MIDDKDSLERRLDEALSKENIDRQVMASLLRGDTSEQLAGALFITSTLLNEALNLVKVAMEKFEGESKSARMYGYFIEYTEDHRRRGKKILDGAKAGHEAVHGTEQDKIERKAKIIEECRLVGKLNKTWKLTAIRAQVAENLQTSAKTVQRATPNLKDLLGRK